MSPKWLGIGPNPDAGREAQLRGRTKRHEAPGHFTPGLPKLTAGTKPPPATRKAKARAKGKRARQARARQRR